MNLQLRRTKEKATLRFILFGLIVAIGLFQLSGCAGTKPDISEQVAEGEELRVYEIFGMDCPGCHGGLENLINKVPGVKTSKANWEKQELKVIIKAGAEVTHEMIHEAIKLANFTAGVCKIPDNQ